MSTPPFRLTAWLWLMPLATLSNGFAHAAEDAPFQLGEVRVSGSSANTPLDPTTHTLSAEDLARFDRNTVGQALNLLPGVTTSTNMRNEQTLTVRGFDGRRTPLFLDGIPVYVPYDGQVDFGRFLTFDLAEIDVAKGFSSIAYGPNTMGGAINLVTRKPQKTLEANAQARVASGNERALTANVGTNQGLWYLQAGAATVSADGYRLASDFAPTPLEDGGQRNNANRQDSKLSLKLGLTPGGGNEYAVGLSSQRGEKGQPPNVFPNAQPLNFWRWPSYDKNSLYLVADQNLTGDERLKVRWYKDSYDYQLKCFTNATYSTGRNCQFGTPAAPTFDLQDEVNGASFILESRRLSGHLVRLAYHRKTDTHDERTTGAVTTYRDRTVSYGLEDTLRLTDRLDLSLGVSRDEQTALTSGNYGQPVDQAKTNAQVGLFYLLDSGTQLYGTLARKSRFPSIRERFSQQVGTQGGMLPGVANPNLGAESARHAEIGLRSTLDRWSLEAALFQARIQDSIQSVSFQQGNTTFGQLRNVGEAESKGVELSARHTTPALTAGAGYTYLDRHNIDTPNLPATDTPRNKVTLFADWLFTPGWRLVGSLEAENGRVVSRANSRTTYFTNGGFALLNAKLVYEFSPGWRIEAGATNLTDHNYQLMDGLPLSGRTLFTQLSVRL